MNYGKKMGGLFLGVLFFLCVGCICSAALETEKTVTMTAFAGEESARQSAGDGAVVTISNLAEFRLFQKALEESEDGLKGYSFQQEADISPGDYHFSYDENMDKFRIYKGEATVAALDRSGMVYGADGRASQTIKTLGLSDLILQTWGDARWFKGQYDGQGYFFRGFLMGIIDGKGASYGGLFCDLGGGTIANVNVSDCCLVACMSPIVNAQMAGDIVNCHVSNIVGAATAAGGIAGLLWNGSIRDCTAENSTYMFVSGYREGSIYGGLGGIVGIIEQCSGGIISNCKAEDMLLYGAEYSQVGTGGIVGVANTSRKDDIKIMGCHADVDMRNSKVAGGIVGKIQGGAYSESNASFVVENCSCSGSMRDMLGSDGCDFGGVAGCLMQGVSNFMIKNCVSYSVMEKTSDLGRNDGTAGGILGSAKENFTVDSVAFAGKIQHEGGEEQANYAGGIVGEVLAGGSVVNSANFGDIVLGRECRSHSGGLIGSIYSSKRVCLENSINVGGVSGSTAGGLVGAIGQGAVHRLHNALSLGKVVGNTRGGLVGEMKQGDVSYCFLRREMSTAFGGNYAGAQYCSMVSESQLAGTEKRIPVFQEGDSAGLCQLVEILNQQSNLLQNRKTYAVWENTQAGYPIFTELVDKLSLTLPPLPEDDSTPVPTPTPGGNILDTPAPGGKKPPLYSQDNRSLKVTGFSAKALHYKCVKLTWKNVSGKGVMIYRSEKKKSGYQLLKQCKKSMKQYIDKTCRPGKKYYYMVRAYDGRDEMLQLGTGRKKRVKTPWLKTPVFRLTRLKDGSGQKYLLITMKKYQGKYVDIYWKRQNGRYLKTTMKTHRISYYRGRMRFTYSRSGVKYRCKLRTYRIKRGKKQYSGFSSVKKISS